MAFNNEIDMDRRRYGINADYISKTTHLKQLNAFQRTAAESQNNDKKLRIFFKQQTAIQVRKKLSNDFEDDISLLCQIYTIVFRQHISIKLIVGRGKHLQ